MMNTNTNSTTTITKMNNNRGGAGEIETFAMANCLMLLSSHNATMAASIGGNVGNEENGRMFACKTCGRKFSSFQALGGHRASHKKVKSANSGEFSDEANFPAKPKVHVCSICFVEFPIGQALGGHMRRHRGMTVAAATGGSAAISSVTTEGSIGNSDGNNDNNNGEKKRKINDDVVLEVPTAVRKSSSKRVCMDVDLNLMLWRKEEKVVEEEDNNVDHEVEEGEIVEQGNDDDFLKLELRQPIRF